jgi:hypothetical protein
MDCSFSDIAKGNKIRYPKREPPMAALDRPDRSETNRCAFHFCLTWIGFFVAIGAFTYLVSLL